MSFHRYVDFDLNLEFCMRKINSYNIYSTKLTAIFFYISFKKDLPPRTKVLHLDQNSIQRLDGMISHYVSLEHLSASENKIGEISKGAFQSLRNLAYLDLSKNRLAKVTKGMFDGLSGLQVRKLYCWHQ